VSAPLVQGLGGANEVAGVSHAALVAISLGAVVFGAMTYIGNAPNFMVRAIAEGAGVKMPSFFGYLAYSAAVLLPLFWARDRRLLRPLSQPRSPISPDAAGLPSPGWAKSAVVT